MSSQELSLLMSKKFFLIFLFLFVSCENEKLPKEIKQPVEQASPIIYKPNASGFIDIDWELLSQTNFRKVYDTDTNDYLPIAYFPDSVRALDKQQIRIKGFLFSLDKAKNEFVLSAKPERESFFCGKDSLDSVILLKLAQKMLVKEAEVYICGKLYLNGQDPQKLSFRLIEASICQN